MTAGIGVCEREQTGTICGHICMWVNKRNMSKIFQKRNIRTKEIHPVGHRPLASFHGL